ncbi:MAG: hypothetical protein HY699_10130 [Deltaproteobacteria bacterium]|nr:hypothetical protein [Deltaproteobacteria bacterium]
MKVWQFLMVTVTVAVTAAAAPARAQDAGARERMKELERRQEQLADELQRLRQSLEQQKTEKKVEEVERRQGILTDELRRLREAVVLPETRELKSAYGLGPAASKVYGLERGLSIGGYGEANFKNVVSDRGSTRDEFDFLRLVLYAGYKFNDWIVFNSETEFEHASTGKKGEVSVEFANLDFLFHPMANLRAGLLLVPMGFINEIHEPPFFHGNVRPQVEQQVLPSTWRANGIGLFGELLPGLQYRTYGVTSLDAKKFRSGGIRSARQSGSGELADDFSWVGRLDYTLLPGASIGASAYLGEQGQNQDFGGVKADVFTQIYEAHAQVRARGLELRGLGALVHVGDAEVLSNDKTINPRAGDPSKLDQPVAEVMLGYYGEIAYDVLPLLMPDTAHYLAPWYRYSRFDTQNSVPDGFRADNTQDRNIHEVGITYKPIPQVALKLDYRVQDAKTGELPDEIRVGGGFVF